jgi:hypothetical protein
MQSPKLSLAGKLDSGLTKCLCLLLGWLKTGSLWLIGLLTLAALPGVIFEYGEGAADLSPLEWGFILLMALLLWRYIHYCRHYSTGIWRGLNRLLMFQGVMSVLGLVIIGLLTAMLARTEYLQSFIVYLMQDDPATKLVSYGAILLAAYLSAPTIGTANSLAPVGMSVGAETTEIFSAKEASL